MSGPAVWCTAVIAGTFAVSAVAGARDLAAFRTAVRAFRVVPRRLVPAAASTVLVAEAAVVVLLAVPATRVVGFVGAAALLVAFTGAMARVLRRGDRTPCACFGRATDPVHPRHLVRNAVLVAVCGAGIALHVAAGPTPWPVAALAVLAAVPVVAAVVALDDLVSLFSPSPHSGSTGSRTTR
ncbi:MauE/DoxX family redox-associated membrane protein [Pseudonocardia lacus]|uniref:MauE/DoxX family redox-associated membrane protein n=1 Tax=Pseudonocardia lacus TaxID=2835865 RepID=UPI001BDD7BFD|nr:MauE/DoxX family redox-associated membrane protein [Pseudonocardia lacus]